MGKKNKNQNDLTGFLGSGTDYHGQLNFEGTLRIDGNFSGTIDSKGTLVVGEKARIEGPVKVATLICSGVVDGDIHATSSLILHKTARIKGSLATPSLLFEEGAVLNGKVHMKSQVKGPNYLTE
ncbi:MAG: bactofilin family protein [Desulfovibrionales bacterium]